MEYTIFLIPVMITGIGYFLNKYPPKKINWIVGYRTIKSMKDENVWKAANQYCGKLWTKIGLIMLVVSCLTCILMHFKIIILSETLLAIIVLCEVVPIVLSGVMVENKIKNDK